MSPPLRGVSLRHRRTCSITRGLASDCDCEPAFEARVYVREHDERIRRCFSTLEQAAAWRSAMLATVGKTSVIAPLTEIRLLVSAKIAQQEREIGEAIPHLLIVLDAAVRAEQLALEDAESLSKVGDVIVRGLPRPPTSPRRTSRPCPKCGLVKPASSFYVRRGGQLSGYCRACQASYQRERARKATAYDALASILPPKEPA